jgi:class 3 adenylate cyclase/predicted ATPase
MRDAPDFDGVRPSRDAASIMRFASLVYDLDACTLAHDSGEAIPLTRGQFALLRMFVTRPGRAISRDTLLDAFTKRRFEPFDRSIDVLVGRLRRKIEADPKRPRLIVTVPGEGYRFDGFTSPQFAKLADADRATKREGTPIAVRASEEARPPAEAASRAGERRHVIALAAELVWADGAGSHDPEDQRVVIDTFRRLASEALGRYGSAIGESRGREITAYFGHRQAQENDAERAVRAALAIQHALSEANARSADGRAPQFAARIGLDSGLVLVDGMGEVFGDAPNIASRVQALAEPGTVVITATIQRQTAGLFVAESCGTRALKGISEPATLYRIVRASGGGRRGGARSLTSLVGREEELDLLTQRWDRACKREGQLALIVGEPGLGKSRLMEEFHRRLGETPHTWVEWSSSQLLQNTTLYPIAEWGRQRFGADLPTEQRLADLENTLNLIGLDPTEYAPLLAPLVDILLPEERVAKLAPEELRRRQLAAITAWVLTSARMQAVVLAFEDLQWADPTSLDLMRALAERGAQAPLLILATARPEFSPSWIVRSHHSVISLSPLDRVQVAKMVSELSAHHALSRDIVEWVSERTGGVPLFVEEVTRLLLERGEQPGAQAIPPTLQQSLTARLDRLGAAREIAQIGAVLGRGFSYALIQSVAGLDEGALRSAFERLTQADILFVEGDGPQAKYRFKHALIQDAAYESLLKSRRQAMHHRAAELLRDQPERAATEPEVIAHHFTQAGLDDLAIEWWGRAGDQALRRSAFQEAIAHFGKAIEMTEALSLIAGDKRQASGQLKLHTSYANAMMSARGYGAVQTKAAFERARELAIDSENYAERFSVNYGLWAGSFVRGEILPMRELAAAVLRDCANRPRSGEASIAQRVSGLTEWFAGEFVTARAHVEQALEVFDAERDGGLAIRFGQDVGVSAMAYSALTLWALGEVALARLRAENMATRTAQIGHVAPAAYGLSHAALFELMRGDHARAAPNAVKLVRLAREHDLPMYGAFGAFLDGWATTAGIATGSGLETMRRGAELLQKQNVLIFDGLLKIALAEAEARAGDADLAVAILDEALATCDRTGHRTFEAELHRARGQILLKRDPADPWPAEEAFLTAIAIAKQQHTRSFELRAALALAKLYHSTARHGEAHAVLAFALAGFSTTPEFPETEEAQEMLAAIESRLYL